MIKRSIILIVYLLCFSQIYAKDSSLVKFDKTNFEAGLIAVKQEVQNQALLSLNPLDSQIKTLLNSFDLKLYKSIKSDTKITPEPKLKYPAAVRQASQKLAYTKYINSQNKAKSEIEKKQEYFHRTAALLTYLKAYDINKMPSKKKEEF